MTDVDTAGGYGQPLPGTGGNADTVLGHKIQPPPSPDFAGVGMARRHRADGSTYYVVTLSIGGSASFAMRPDDARGLSAALIDMADRAEASDG